MDADKSKFALALIALAAATGMLALGRIGGDAWVSGMSWIVAAYMLGQPAAIFASGWMQTQARVAAAEVRRDTRVGD